MAELAAELEEQKQKEQLPDLCGECWEEIEYCFCEVIE